jgi:hypothetical protein
MIGKLIERLKAGTGKNGKYRLKNRQKLTSRIITVNTGLKLQNFTGVKKTDPTGKYCFTIS